jgi:hypothetical protein
LQVLGNLRIDAAKRLATGWEEFRSMFTDAHRAGELLDFIERLRRAKIGEDGRLLISLLANNRSVTTNTVISQKVVYSLIKVGILGARIRVRNGGGNRYPLARPWSLMFDELLNRHDCPPAIVN